MSWEYSKFKVICRNCGREGTCIEGADDWGRFSRYWEGFKNVPADITAVGRKKTDSHCNSAICNCGESEFIKNKYISEV